MKVAMVVGTRPEIIRLSSTIKLAKKVFDTVLIHTGQNYDYELNQVFFDELGLDKPDYYLDCNRENIGYTVGDIIAKTYNLFIDIKPDALIILGDTNSCMCAYSAKRLKIPIFHLEAGNRCRDPNVPEEINRKIIDHISDINMCYMEHARRNLLQEGLRSEYIFVLGSPMKEVLKGIGNKIYTSKILNSMKLEKNKYILVSAHREENISIEKNFHEIVCSIINMEKEFGKIIVSTHPRTRKMLEEKNIKFNDNIILCKPFGIIDYCALQKNALCVVSDSGTLTEESTMLNFPAVLLRNSTEHPEGIDAGNIILGDIKSGNLIRSIKLAINLSSSNNNNIIQDYTDDNFSQKVCRIVSGYTGIVNKFIWMK
jgi:UDP-N-acetylglucosamine 2-epimerase